MIPTQELCDLAAAAYREAPTWRAAGDVFARMTRMDGISVVAFRGTDPRRAADIRRDLDWWPRRHPHLGYCHRGFLDGALAIEKAVRRGLPSGPVILTGHSLGGALALVMAGLLSVRGRPPFAVVTFGAPRVGMFRLAAELGRVRDLRLYRNGNDPVPMVPWALPWLPYHHPRRLIPIGTPRDIGLECHALAAYRAALG